MSGRRAALYMGAFAATWAIIEQLGGRLLTAYSPFQVVFTRYVVHLAVLFGVAGFRDPLGLVRSRRLVFQCARSVLMLGMPFCFVFAFRAGVDPRTAMAIFWLSPLLIVVGAAFLLRERPSLHATLGTLAATAGTLLLIGFGGLPAWRLLVLPLGMAATFSVYVVMTRSLRNESTRTNLFYTAAGVALLLAPVMPRLWITPTPGDLLAMIGIGVLGLFGLFALDRATALAPLATTAPLLCLQLPLYIALDCYFDPTRVRLRNLVGITVVLASVLFLWLSERRRALRAASG